MSDIILRVTSYVFSLPSSFVLLPGKFPEGTTIASAAVADFRRARGTPAAPDGEEVPYDMEDLLVSLSSRVELIKNYGKDILDAAVRIFNTF